MMSPKELYDYYSQNACGSSIFGEGNGTPYELKKLVKFLKHIKYPCYSSAPHTTANSLSEPADPSGILGTGKNKVALPFKFVTRLDAEAFTEIQPTIHSGTSHGIRNACEITRACDIEQHKNYSAWEHRMATEYIEHFGNNSLPDCLMMLGPDIIYESDLTGRAMGCGPMSCWAPKYVEGTIGADHTCTIMSPFDATSKCASCSPCSVNPVTGEPDPNDPCCSSDCVKKTNECCKAPQTNRSDFSYYAPSEDGLFSGSQLGGFIDIALKHVGILKRKLYGGLANFLNNTGPNFNACPDIMFLKSFQAQNCHRYSPDVEPDTTYCLDRMKTICILSGTSQKIVDDIKDLIYNGYGVALFSNVGFSNTRDSTGLSYPDRIWYHTFAIIGYDDRKVEYNECVYLLANSWGKWNSGGRPSWGPIPDGSFLVTESHLKCMVAFNQNPDFVGCKKRFCPEPCDAVTAKIYAGCTQENSCIPFECSANQSAFGLAVALSTKDGFPARTYLDYKQFYPVNSFKYKEPKDTLIFRQP